jgi:hypothetical protein
MFGLSKEERDGKEREVLFGQIIQRLMKANPDDWKQIGAYPQYSIKLDSFTFWVDYEDGSISVADNDGGGFFQKEFLVNLGVVRKDAEQLFKIVVEKRSIAAAETEKRWAEGQKRTLDKLKRELGR